MPEPEEPRREAPSRPQEAAASLERLVSEETFAASTAALSQLSRTMRKGKDAQIGGGRMVEDLVREALEPMLKTWLDANLQGIVERLVRQEIERMVRRAEED
jgi:cell pole-organizing protein PopZ